MNRRMISIVVASLLAPPVCRAETDPAKGGAIMPQKPQMFVAEPAAGAADKLLELTPRYREIYEGQRVETVGQFGAGGNQRGVEGLRLAPFVEAEELTAAYRRELEVGLYRQVAEQLTEAGVSVLGPGGRLLLDLEKREEGCGDQPVVPSRECSGWENGRPLMLPKTAFQNGEIPMLIPRRPFLGQPAQLTRRPLPGTRPPNAFVSPFAPDLNRLVVHLKVDKFQDGQAAVMAVASFQRPAGNGNFPTNPNFEAGTVWQGQAYRAQTPWPPAAVHLAPAAEAVTREWLQALGSAAPSPERLPDAAHLPGAHRLLPYAGETAAIPPWRESQWMISNYPAFDPDKRHGMDNHACLGAGRRWNPVDGESDPCARFPQGE